MRKSGFFPRLALVNLVRNGRFYGPYLLSCSVTAAMYYILLFLSYNKGLDTVRGDMYLKSFAGIGCFVAALLSGVLLCYANSFVMKRRQRELGLYNILGLENATSPGCACGKLSSAPPSPWREELPWASCSARRCCWFC